MLHRIVKLLLLACLVGGGVCPDGDASSKPLDAGQFAGSAAIPPPRAEQHNVADQWEFIRNSSVSGYESSAEAFSLDWSAPQRLDGSMFAARCAIHADGERSMGLVLLCDRAALRRSGVLKA